MIAIDGSLGEGGGQVLRTALTLSVITGTPVRVTNIRAGRPKSGLRAQHLKAVEAAQAVSNAQVQGASMGSTLLEFQPGSIQPGRFRFDIGTAGSTSLVLQTVFLPLSQTAGPSTITITGGTHVPWSPCFHYLDLHWLSYMHQIGFSAQLTLELAGFFPAGRGSIQANITPAEKIRPLSLMERGVLRRISGLSGVANLSPKIAIRQRDQAYQRLKDLPSAQIDTIALPARVKGTFLLLLAEFEHTQFCTFALGKRGKPAEQVADEAVDALDAFLASDGAVDHYLADQLLLPLAIADGVSQIRTAKVSGHLTTNAEVIRRFLPVHIEFEGQMGAAGLVHITPG
jgi:RNA 3'-terminal phosphate cyclase (ATP)